MPASEHPLLEAQVLAAHILNHPKSWIVAHPETNLDSQQAIQMDLLLERLSSGEPLPYLLRHQEFYGLDFMVNDAVLIPRPETELLVEEAIHWLQLHPDKRLAADVGSGSGCIAICLAHHIPDLTLVASDLSRPALEVAQFNIMNHALNGQISLVQCELLEPLAAGFDLICANLPYIPSGQLEDLAVSKYEPRIALDGGRNGLALIRPLLEWARNHLSPGGLILLEIEPGLQESLTAQARQLFPTAGLCLLPDLSGTPRLLRIEEQTALH